MKGLDNYIMGINDSNAPFNQVDFVDFFDNALDKCDWVSDSMIDEMPKHLEQSFYDALEIVQGEKYLSSKNTMKFIRDNSQQIADKAKAIYFDAVSLDLINASDIEAIEKESRWSIHAWWRGGKINKENLTKEAREKLLNIVESCRESL